MLRSEVQTRRGEVSVQVKESGLTAPLDFGMEPLRVGLLPLPLIEIYSGDVRDFCTFEIFVFFLFNFMLISNFNFNFC